MKSQQEKAAYAARVIRTFLDETSGPYDWDDFTSCSLRDREVDSIRFRASGVNLPVDADGQRELLALAGESDRLATGVIMPTIPQRLTSRKMATRPDRSSTSQRVAHRWIVGGAAMVAFASLFAIAAFGFGMSVHDGNTDRLATKAETASALLFVGGIGGIFLAVGALIRRSR